MDMQLVRLGPGKRARIQQRPPSPEQLSGMLAGARGPKTEVYTDLGLLDEGAHPHPAHQQTALGGLLGDPAAHPHA